MSRLDGVIGKRIAKARKVAGLTQAESRLLIPREQREWNVLRRALPDLLK